MFLLFVFQAIYNFVEEGEFRLHLNVGDAVVILRECEDWYYGYNKCNSKQGIFPKNYICIQQRSGNMESLMNEVTSVLREWGYYYKQLYVVCTIIYSLYEKK